MNILLLAPSYPDKKNIWNGIFFKEQAHALSKKHRVNVVSASINYETRISFFKYKMTTYSEKNLYVNKLYIARSLPVYNQVNYFITSFLFIKKLMKGKKIDIIHCHYAYPIGVLGYILSRYFKVPYIITEHASKFENRFRSFIHKKLALKSLEKADRIIAVGNSLKKEIEKYIINPISVVPNVVNVSKFYSAERDSKFINLGFLGSLDDNRKGLDLLFSAIYKIQNQNYLLHIGGNGKFLEKYKNLSRKLDFSGKCIFYGNIKPEKVPDFFSKLDIFILPSRKESFGVVVIEAMAAGIPVIATICGGPEDIVTKETGLLIEKDNVDQLREAIEYMIINFKKYNNKLIRDYVTYEYGVDSFVNKLTEIYEELITWHDQ
jgi:L-malate glycosyltransferase